MLTPVQRSLAHDSHWHPLVVFECLVGPVCLAAEDFHLIMSLQVKYNCFHDIKQPVESKFDRMILDLPAPMSTPKRGLVCHRTEARSSERAS